MYRITLVCHGVPAEQGAQGATDITEEFTHRPHHQNVKCTWDGKSLVLYAENDWDDNGLGLMDEFSDAISVCIKDGFDGNIEIHSIILDS